MSKMLLSDQLRRLEVVKRVIAGTTPLPKNTVKDYLASGLDAIEETLRFIRDNHAEITEAVRKKK